MNFIHSQKKESISKFMSEEESMGECIRSSKIFDAIPPCSYAIAILEMLTR